MWQQMASISLLEAIKHGMMEIIHKINFMKPIPSFRKLQKKSQSLIKFNENTEQTILFINMIIILGRL